MTGQQLPLPDYDELPIGSLRHEMRALREDELRTLLEHERAHAARTQAIQLLTSRIEELEQGAELSPGDPRTQSERPTDTRHGSPVSPDSAASPSGPLRHGVAGQTPERDKPS